MATKVYVRPGALLFHETPLRWVLPVVLLGIMAPFIALEFLPDIAIDPYELSPGLMLLEIAASIVPGVLLWAIWGARHGISTVFGPALDRHIIRKVALLGVPMVCSAIFFYYLLYYPLSFVAPDFVVEWAIEGSEIVAPAAAPHSSLTNLLSAAMLVVVAPVFEELLFRGFLFGRLSTKIGVGSAIIVSSAFFAILHPDVIGAFVFGLFACLLYLRYQTLMAPMVLHAANNFVVFALVWGDTFLLEAEYEYTLAEFRSELWWAILAGAIGLPWLYRYYQANLKDIRWPTRVAAESP